MLSTALGIWLKAPGGGRDVALGVGVGGYQHQRFAFYEKSKIFRPKPPTDSRLLLIG